MWRRFVRWMVLVLLLSSSGVTAPVAAQPAPVSAGSLKAVLLFKLPMFVYRGEEATSGAVEICIFGLSGLESGLQQLAGRAAPERPVTVRPWSLGEPLQACTLLFISRSEAAALRAVLDEAAAVPGLVTVSDIVGFAEAGGMVQFGMNAGDNTLSITINRQAARAQGVESNAQLLRLARTIGE